jgi:hypothetical protein
MHARRNREPGGYCLAVGSMHEYQPEPHGRFEIGESEKTIDRARRLKKGRERERLATRVGTVAASTVNAMV